MQVRALVMSPIRLSIALVIPYYLKKARTWVSTNRAQKDKSLFTAATYIGNKTLHRLEYF